MIDEEDLENYKIEWCPHEKIKCIEFTGEHFHIKQSYDEEFAKEIKCKICGSKDFNVAMGSYFTAIRCNKCRWETCIHAG